MTATDEPATVAGPVTVRRYRDGSRVETSDVPGFLVAVTPKGTRVRDSETRLVMLFPTVETAEIDLAGLGYGAASGRAG